MLEGGKMGKWKVLCRSEKGQIVMARRVGQTISKKGKNSGTSIRAFRSNRPATVAQTDKTVHARSDKKVSECRVYCSLLHMGLHSCKPDIGAHADPCPLQKAPTVGT